MEARRRNLGTPSPKQEDSMQKSRQTMKGRKLEREKQDQTQLNKRYTYKQKQSIPNATTPVPS